MKPINELLKMAAAEGASDLHVKVGSPPVMRINGDLAPVSDDRITMEDTVRACLGIMSPYQREAFKRSNDIDLAYSVPGLGRFRVNIFVQRGALGLVCRLIPMNIPTVEELGLPAVLNKLADEERGLVLVTGTTGSGKSTTLASLIDRINSTRNSNIVTIEDPIEFLHKDKRGLVNQREIGADTQTFSVALRAALRQDPDVILLGEMRDLETIETGMMAAETGHLVLSTLHTLDASETVNRIISAFPPHQQSQVRVQLASILRGIVSMRLVQREDGLGRMPAVEVMITTGVIRECIIDPARTKLIHDFISQGKVHYGMQTFDQSLLEHLQTGRITYEEALKSATNPEDFRLKVQGVSSSTDVEEATPQAEDDAQDKLDSMIDRFQS